MCIVNNVLIYVLRFFCNNEEDDDNNKSKYKLYTF